MRAQPQPDNIPATTTLSLATMATGPTMNDLPVELLDMILGLVGALPPVRTVCRSWRHRLDYLVDSRRCRHLTPNCWRGGT